MTTAQVFLSVKDVAKRYSTHEKTPWRWVRQGKFPHPVKINGATRWRLSDLQAWESEQEGVA